MDSTILFRPFSPACKPLLRHPSCSALVYLGLHNEKLHEFFDRLGLPVAEVQTGMKDAV